LACMSDHHCDAIVVVCIDFRFQKYIRNWTDTHLENKTFDLVGYAGSTKNLDTIIEQIGISVGLHSIKEVYLIHHEECGAYGSESTFERHSQDLKKAKEMILAENPALRIYLYYLHLNGQFDKVV